MRRRGAAAREPAARRESAAGGGLTLAEGLVLLALAIGVGLFYVCGELNPFDEALVLVGGERVLHGELPFKDFYAIYPPGQYYVVAGLMKLFGRSALTLRLYCIAVRAMIALLLYAMAKRLVPRPLALACWATCVWWLTNCGFYGYPTFPALLLVLLSLALLASSVDRARAEGAPSKRHMLAAGGALGAAALFRHDLAAYGFLAGLPLMIPLARSRATAHGPPRSLADAARPLLAFLGGLVLMFGIPAASLLAVVPAREVLFELFTYPSKTYASVRGLPYPPLFAYPSSPQVLSDPILLLGMLRNLPAYTPLLFNTLGLLGCVAQIRARGREALDDATNLRALALVILGLLAFNLARVRADLIHSIAMVVPSYLVAAVLLRSAWNGARFWRWPATIALMALALLSLATPLLLSYRAIQMTATSARCRSAGAQREEAAAYVRSVVPPGDRIFVGCGRHDIVFANEPILYFLAQRLPGTKYHVLDPGVATTLEVQREIVDGLIRARVEYVVLSTAFDGRREPNLSSVSSGVTTLDDYLRAHYRVDREFGPDLAVWKRLR